MRTAEGLGVQQVFLTGYTPYPLGADNDDRLPHLAQKIDRQIVKTALGAEKLVSWQHKADIKKVLAELKSRGFKIAGLEQTPNSISLPTFLTPPKLALIVGREVEGIEPAILELCDLILEIPMFGQKESFNVVQAAAMALYHFRYGRP
jgi:tRNA G18 (ribose-2'-O)-methylase SpoU